MITEHHAITVSGIRVAIVRKAIKNLHLGVYPPNGRVRVAVPLAVSNEAVRLAVVGKLGWIRRQQKKFERQPRQSQRQMVSGESHYFLGRRYRLRVVPKHGAAEIVLRNKSTMELHVRQEADAEQRERVLREWYRRQLKELIPPLLNRWQAALHIQVNAWGIKRMKTKWGSCNPKARRIWLNLELAKKPKQCLEYIIVHEMVHVLEPRHDDRFLALMDRFMPRWRVHREELNDSPLGHEIWKY
jgi:predicted metal-dependent hydrolase